MGGNLFWKNKSFKIIVKYGCMVPYQSDELGSVCGKTNADSKEVKKKKKGKRPR